MDFIKCKKYQRNFIMSQVYTQIFELFEMLSSICRDLILVYSYNVFFRSKLKKKEFTEYGAQAS